MIREGCGCSQKFLRCLHSSYRAYGCSQSGGSCDPSMDSRLGVRIIGVAGSRSSLEQAPVLGWASIEGARCVTPAGFGCNLDSPELFVFLISVLIVCVLESPLDTNESCSSRQRSRK